MKDYLFSPEHFELMLQTQHMQFMVTFCDIILRQNLAEIELEGLIERSKCAQQTADFLKTQIASQ